MAFKEDEKTGSFCREKEEIRCKSPPNVFHEVMDTVANKGWQIVQGKDDLKVLVVHPGEGVSEVKPHLVKALQKQGVKVPEIHVETVDSIPKAKSGKSPLIQAYKE